jgi:hypothetical protein
MYFLPTYSPDLNPDESLNHDVKANALGRRRPLDEWDMMANVRGYLRARQRQPALVRAYFYGAQVQYAMGSGCQL